MSETTTTTTTTTTARPMTHVEAGTHVRLTTENGGLVEGDLIFPVQVPDGTGLGDQQARIVDDFTGRVIQVGTPTGPLATVTVTGLPPLVGWVLIRNAWLATQIDGRRAR